MVSPQISAIDRQTIAVKRKILLIKRSGIPSPQILTDGTLVEIEPSINGRISEVIFAPGGNLETEKAGQLPGLLGVIRYVLPGSAAGFGQGLIQIADQVGCVF